MIDTPAELHRDRRNWRRDRLHECAAQILIAAGPDRARDDTAVDTRARRVEVHLVERARHTTIVAADAERLEVPRTCPRPHGRCPPIMTRNGRDEDRKSTRLNSSHSSI